MAVQRAFATLAARSTQGRPEERDLRVTGAAAACCRSTWPAASTRRGAGIEEPADVIADLDAALVATM